CSRYRCPFRYSYRRCLGAAVIIGYRYCIGCSCGSCRESCKGGCGSAVAPEVGVGRGSAAGTYLYASVSTAVATYVADYRGCSRYLCWFRDTDSSCGAATVVIRYGNCIGCSSCSCGQPCNGRRGLSVAPEVGVGRGAAAGS